MPKFSYTAKDYKDGSTKGGSMEAEDERSLAHQLHSEGYMLTSVHQEKEKFKVKVSFLSRFQGVPIKEKMIFARNLSIMISSGLSVARAIRVLSLQTKNKRFRAMLEQVSDDLQSGNQLADALARHPGAFDELFVNMVRVGEIAGNLEDVLDIVATQIEKEHALISKVRGAMTYPAVILVAMFGVGVLMLTYILPKITAVFKDMDVQLPASTMFIINTSNFLRDHAFISTGLLVGSVLFFIMFLKTQIGKMTVSFIIIHLPMIKNIAIKVNCARFARIYSSLLKSGVPVVDTLGIVANTLTNFYYKRALLNCVTDIQKGVVLSKAIVPYRDIFPLLLVQIVEVGEETGKTEEVLLKLAEFYEEEVDQVTKNMSSIIEPVLMVVIGISVGFFAVAMLQPMYSVMENIR